MIDTIYIEEQVAQHPRTREILQRWPDARRIPCDHYGEILNRRAQNFALQKTRPALVLAKKHNRFVLPAPSGYGIGARRDYYFSHMLNCLYDCRYCFLQGMYRSAHYVLFVNYEDFMDSINATAAANPGEQICFYSGYDCDSLALEPVTGFADWFLPQLAGLDNVWMEFRTKSTQVRGFLDRPVLPQAIIAFSFTPEEIGKALEHRVPRLQRRIEAMVRLQQLGWSLGLRFDPLIYTHDYQRHYQQLFDELFARLHPQRLHSVSYGTFRMPETFFNNSLRLYPRERLFAGPMAVHKGMVSYRDELEQEMMDWCHRALAERLPANILFPCRY